SSSESSSLLSGVAVRMGAAVIAPGPAPDELDGPAASTFAVSISVSSSITSRDPYRRCNSNIARTCASLSTQKILNLNWFGGKRFNSR
ncbi:hypothetical protein PIB30_052866, partial [Stylosanthes scabra]|nr:hypothetical protein [Stylosanthes scabra]